MNKKEAIAYGQIAFETIMNSNYTNEKNLTNFGIEMKQAFKLYPRNVVLNIADGKIYAEKKLNNIKNGCDVDGK